jgi:hypothetical protein
MWIHETQATSGRLLFFFDPTPILMRWRPKERGDVINVFG